MVELQPSISKCTSDYLHIPLSLLFYYDEQQNTSKNDLQ